MSGLDICPDCEAAGKTIPTDGCLKCDDWRDPSVWIKANPNLGISIKPKYLKEQVEEAVSMPSKQNIVKRLNFCIWTEGVTKWLNTDLWNVCGRKKIEETSLHGRKCYAGLDLSSTTDVSALVYVFPPIEEGDAYDVLCRFFIPKDNLAARVTRDRVPYDVWERQGFLTTTPGNVIDYDFILHQIDEDLRNFDVKEIAFDRWGATKIVQSIQKMSTNEEFLVEFGQGFQSMASPTKSLETMILKKQISHGGHPVLAWMASNAVVRHDPAGNIKPDKEKSTEKIDGIVALIMALDRALKYTDNTSVYETRGVTFF
jgi:phage terminase large subunit-like protein